jgi:signal transduction histidine kinase
VPVHHTDASHELRTPLTTIRGFVELYRRGAARDVEFFMFSFAIAVL